MTRYRRVWEGHPPHDFNAYWDRCRFCGARWNDIEDNLASINCDMFKQVTTAQVLIPVTIGIIWCSIIFAGIFL